MRYTAEKILVLFDEADLSDASVAEILRAVGLSISDLTRSDAPLDLPRVIAVFREVLRRTRRPDVAFNAGRRVRFTHFGVFGLAVMSQASLLDGLRFTIKYRPLTSPLIGLNVVVSDDRCSIELFPHAPLCETDPVFPRLLDYNIGMFSALIEDATGRRDTLLAIRLGEWSDAQTERAASTLGIDVHVDAGVNAIDIRPDRLHEPLVGTSVIGAAAAQKLCDEAMAQSEAGSQFLRSIRRCLYANAEKPVTAAFVAGELGISERGLRRKLAEESLAFRSIKADVQTALAKQYLCQTGMTIKDIAKATGFSDVANFRRAFRRVHGQTPQDFRASQ